MEGEWSCYRGQYNGGRMVMLWRWSVSWRKNGYVTEVVTLMEGEWSCYRGGQCREGEWLCYRIGQFNGGRMVMISLMEGEWFCYRGGLVNGGGLVMLERWLV